jgi:hypothetical protein
MAELIIDLLEKIQIDDGDRTRNVTELDASHFVIQRFHYVTPVQHSSQFIQLSKFFDPLIGNFKLNSTLMERSSRRISKGPKIGTLADRQNK